MTDLTLTKTRMAAGVWEGVLTRTGTGNVQPDLAVSHQNEKVAGWSVAEDAATGTWVVLVPVPADLIADGVQTFVISDARSGETLASFALLAGEALAEDIRAEIDLLRAELDMLKRAFRRHCVETA